MMCCSPATAIRLVSLSCWKINYWASGRGNFHAGDLDSEGVVQMQVFPPEPEPGWKTAPRKRPLTSQPHPLPTPPSHNPHSNRGVAWRIRDLQCISRECIAKQRTSEYSSRNNWICPAAMQEISLCFNRKLNYIRGERCQSMVAIRLANVWIFHKYVYGTFLCVSVIIKFINPMLKTVQFHRGKIDKSKWLFIVKLYVPYVTK